MCRPPAWPRPPPQPSRRRPRARPRLSTEPARRRSRISLRRALQAFPPRTTILAFTDENRWRSHMWKWLEDKFAALVAFLCVLFEAAPEKMDDGQRGNLPPPQGGISSIGER